MLRRRMAVVVSVLVLTVLLIACGEPDEPTTATDGLGAIGSTPMISPTVATDPAATPAFSDLAGTDWTLTSINGTFLNADTTITLSLDSNGGHGNTGCNDYYVNPYAATSNDFSISVVTTGPGGCPEQAGILESTYIEALGSTKSYTMTDDLLMLANADGETTLVFVRAGQPVATPPAGQPDETVTPSPVTSVPTPNMAAPSPTAPYVDVAPLDNPELGVDVHWLGLQFDPDGELPALSLTSVYAGGGPADSRAELEYSTEPFASAIDLRLMRRADWNDWTERDPASDDMARLLHMFWDSPCAQQEEIELEGGSAVIYSSYQALAATDVTECPSGPFDRFLAHAFFGDTVVLVNAPLLLEPPDMPGEQGPYDTVEGLRAIVQGLQLREPVTEPTPLPTPAASLDDPGSLVLQPADLPGRYDFGDDGCSPRYECFAGPVGFSLEGGYDELGMAAGAFLSTYVQYEHVGFNANGTPDPNIEPPRIDTFTLICVQDCEPAAILAVGPELLRYHGHSEAAETGLAPDLGDAALLYEVNTLVLGQTSPGYAVVWRDGPLVGMLVVGGVPGESGQAIAIELAGRQAERLQQALEQ